MVLNLFDLSDPEFLHLSKGGWKYLAPKKVKFPCNSIARLDSAKRKMMQIIQLQTLDFIFVFLCISVPNAHMNFLIHRSWKPMNYLKPCMESLISLETNGGLGRVSSPMHPVYYWKKRLICYLLDRHCGGLEKKNTALFLSSLKLLKREKFIPKK